MSRPVLLGVLLAMAAVPVAAQQLVPRDFPVKDVESFSLESPSMGRRYDIVVGLPEAYAANPAKAWPVLVVTDGNATFTTARDAARNLTSQGDIGGLIVVSIGTPLEGGDSAWTRRRIHEFSPPDWPMTDRFGQLVRRLCETTRVPAGECTGGAPKFLRFIESEVLPLVQAKYRVDPAQLGLFGVSAGGFFASWAIFQPESPFTTYIISSPAMAYGDGEIYRQEAKYADGHKDLKAGIYLASGTLEMDHPELEGVGQIVSGQMRLGAALRGRKYPGLRLYSEMHQGLGHSDAAGTTLVRGMRLLYGTRP